MQYKLLEQLCQLEEQLHEQLNNCMVTDMRRCQPAAENKHLEE
jgi:hypothetical protein